MTLLLIHQLTFFQIFCLSNVSQFCKHIWLNLLMSLQSLLLYENNLKHLKGGNTSDLISLKVSFKDIDESVVELHIKIFLQISRF